VQGGAGTRRPKLFLPETCLALHGLDEIQPVSTKKKKPNPGRLDWVGFAGWAGFCPPLRVGYAQTGCGALGVLESYVFNIVWNVIPSH
jgi:hypothetical protein